MPRDPRRNPALVKTSPQVLCGPTKVLSAGEKARLKDQTVPYVGEVLPTYSPPGAAYPHINPGAVQVVRALLESPSPSAARPGDPLVGRVIGDRYEISGLLASGGMGRVYRARQSSLGRTVAVKILEREYSRDPNAAKRFHREAAIASKLRHPNTVKIFDYGVTDDDVCYIAMELLAGRTLRQALRHHGTFTAERTIHIARQVCRSLAEAHSLGAIHRDLKPSNIHLVRHGNEHDFVKVLDFGLVKEVEEEGEALTQTGLFMGSPQYSSPEQIRGKVIDARTDIYSLGVVMHEMLTGNLPFQQEGSIDVLMAHLHEPVPDMGELIANDVSPALQAVVKKCMAKAPDQRFDSMEQLYSALVDASGKRSSRTSAPPRSTVSTPAAPSGTARTQSRPAKATKRTVTSRMVTLLAALLAAALLLLPSRVHDSPEQTRAVADAVSVEKAGNHVSPAPEETKVVDR